MPAVPCPCRLYIGPATGKALVVLDIVMSLHVNCQLMGLHELFLTLNAMVVLHSSVPFLVDVPVLDGLERLSTSPIITACEGP